MPSASQASVVRGELIEILEETALLNGELMRLGLRFVFSESLLRCGLALFPPRGVVAAGGLRRERRRCLLGEVGGCATCGGVAPGYRVFLVMGFVGDWRALEMKARYFLEGEIRKAKPLSRSC